MAKLIKSIATKGAVTCMVSDMKTTKQLIAETMNAKHILLIRENFTPSEIQMLLICAEKYSAT